jgi:hypothetical protein
MARQLVVLGQVTWVSAETVTPVKVPVDQAPTAIGPETMTGELAVVVVATARHPVAVEGHWRPESAVTLEGRVSAVQQSDPTVQPPLVDPMVPLRATAEPVLVVPMATHWVDDGQTT